MLRFSSIIVIYAAIWMLTSVKRRLDMEIATWVIAIFTIFLTFATISYAWISYLSYKASNKQSEALNELSKAIREIGPSIISSQTRKENQRKLVEEMKKNNPQRRALGGH